MKGYIYKHTSPSGKSYVGQTRQEKPSMRWKHGKGYLKGSQSTALSGAIRKYGWKCFTHEILETVEVESEIELVEILNQLEEDYILRLGTLAPNGYNLGTGGRAHIVLDSTRGKMSRSSRRFHEARGAYIRPKKFICEKCGKEVVSTDNHFSRARKRFSGRVLCSNCKRGETLLESSGFSSPLQDPEVLKQKQETMLKKFGAKAYNKGKKLTEEEKQKWIGENNPMFGKTGVLSPRSRPVINTTTGETFDCLLYAAESVGGSRHRLRESIDLGKPYHGCIFNWV